MKTLLIGNFGAGNIGDEIILLSALKEYPDAVVMTSDAQWSQYFLGQTFPCVEMPPTGIRSFVKQKIFALRDETLASVRYDIKKIVFPGGGLFAIKPQAYWIWYQVIRWVKKNFPDTPIELQHQGMDMPADKLSGWCLKEALKLVDKVSVRDKESKEVVEMYSFHIAEIVGDRGAIWIKSNRTEKLKKEKKDKRRVLINTLEVFDFEYIKKQFPGSQYIFVAFEEKDLKSVFKEGMKAVHEKKFDPQKEWEDPDTLVAVYPQTLEDVYELFECASICVGQRLHFLILAEAFCMASNTYVLGKPYSKKVQSFVNDLHIEELIDTKK